MKNARALSSTLETGGYLADAIKSLTGVTHALDVAEQAKALLKQLAASEMFVESPLNSPQGRVTMEWLDLVVAQELATGELRRRQRILESLIEQAQQEAVSGVELNGDQLLRMFAEDLDSLLDEVRAAVSDLKGARTAGAAIASGTTASWAELQEIVERHTVIRAAQNTVMVNSFPELLAAHSSAWSIEVPASDCYMANLDQVWPGSTYRGRPRPDAAGGRVEPWPADDVEQLIWAATTSVQPWIPGPQELHELSQRRIEERRKESAARGNRALPTAAPRW